MLLPPSLLSQSQRRILDLAHKLDPSYAASLAELIDDDPARMTSRRDVKQHLQLLDVKKKLAEQSTANIDPIASKSDYPKASWMNLGGLNAGRIETFRVDFIRTYTEAAGNFKFDDAYPILSWVIENSVKRFSKNAQEKPHLISMFESTLLGAELTWRIAARSLAKMNKLKTQTTMRRSGNEPLVFGAGDRDKAVKHLREWFEREVVDYLKICDPYFSVEDLEILKLLRSSNPNCKVFILTSRKQQEQNKLPPPWDDAYRNYWRVQISDQEPPFTEIVIVGAESSGESPIHDRWWLTKGQGLRVGTSYNSLGVTKSSEISILSPDEAVALENEVDQYLQGWKREYGGERLRYLRFDL